MDNIKVLDTNQNAVLKSKVKSFWEEETCGTRYGVSNDDLKRIKQIEELRYIQIPEIPGFADFAKYEGKDVLEIGVGAGTDFSHWVRVKARATGVDLTESAIHETRKRLHLLGPTESYNLRVADAENLPFLDNSFDLITSTASEK